MENRKGEGTEIELHAYEGNSVNNYLPYYLYCLMFFIFNSFKREVGDDVGA